MQDARLLQVITAALAVVVAARVTAAQPAGRTSPNVVLSFDAPVDQAPTSVCIVSAHACRDPARCETVPLSALLAPTVGALVPGEGGLYTPHVPSRATLEDANGQAIAGADKVMAVFQGLPVRGTEARSCAADGPAVCGAGVGFPDVTSRGTPFARLTCGSGAAPGQRVVFVKLTFGDPLVTMPVIEVRYAGTTATVIFEKPIPTTTVTLAQVLGGDYAASDRNAVGVDGMAVVPLQPRCSTVLAELPDGVSRLDAVALDVDGKAHACTPPKTASKVLPIRLPYLAAPALKTLRVSRGAEGKTVTAEASWTDRSPPVPMRLGVRSIGFEWRGPAGCLAERWEETTPEASQTGWNRDCPRVTLAANGTRCELRSAEVALTEAPPSCAYLCQLSDELATLSLPIELELARVRADPSVPGTEVVVHRWRDRLAYAGQTLDSTVAPEDRRLMIEFAPGARETWRDGAYDRLDGIRFVNPDGRWNQIDLTRIDGSGPPPVWLSLPAPNLTCPARVRVAMFGSRRYRESTLDIDRGRIVLGKRDSYVALSSFHIVGALGSHRIGYGHAQLGFGVRLDTPERFRLSATLDGIAQFVAQDYQAIHGATPETDWESYVRFGLRLGVELWLPRDFRIGVGAGGWIGTTFDDAGEETVGDLQGSWTGDVLGLWYFRRTTALTAGAGLRFGEVRYRYDVDTGVRSVDREIGSGGFVTVGFRTRL